MEKRATEITSGKNKGIKIKIIKGHFATNHSHVNYYVDLTRIKKTYKPAKETARIMAMKYINTPIDTIICLEGTQMIGGFIAENLAEAYPRSVNHGHDICVMTPELNSNNQMIFRDNTQGMILGRQVLLLVSSVSTGWTIQRGMECLKYYGGDLAAISALFSAIDTVDGMKIHTIFHMRDLPGYTSCSTAECPLCAEKVKVDAIINEDGYSKI